jgi:hypothetical protein
MPTFQDPAADAAQAQHALRGLAHATRTINDPISRAGDHRHPA